MSSLWLEGCALTSLWDLRSVRIAKAGQGRKVVADEEKIHERSIEMMEGW